MKRKILLFLLVFCAVFSLASCSDNQINNTKTLKLENNNAVIEYDFRGFEYLEPGKIYPVIYKAYDTENLDVVTYTSPAELYVVKNIDGTTSFFIQYVHYTLHFEGITLDVAKHLSENGNT